MKAGLGKADGADLGEVPVVIARGRHGQAAVGGGLAVEIECHRVGLKAVEALDTVGAGAGDVESYQ